MSASTSTDVDILLVGNFAKDHLIVDGQSEISSGGSVYYGSIALSRLGLRLAIVTRLHPDDFHRLDEVTSEGIQVFASPAPETSGIANYYRSADMERRICKTLGFAGAISIQDIPDISVCRYLVGPLMAGEVHLPLLAHLAKRAPVALDAQGFVRVPHGDDLIFRQWQELEEGLSHVSTLKVDRAEAELLTGESNLSVAARRLSEYGPTEVLITQTSGVTVYADGALYQAPFTPRSLEGRTGRGDTCFATYLGKRLSNSPEVACCYAAAITTLKQEHAGPWRGTMAEVAALLDSWQKGNGQNR